MADAQSVVSGGFRAGGKWAIRFPAFDKLKFSAVLRGACWLRVEGRKRPVRLEAGDVLLLSGSVAFTLASDLAVRAIEAASVFIPGVTEIVQLNREDDFFQIGGFIRLDSETGSFLTSVLPPFIHIRAASPQASMLKWLLEQLLSEHVSERPGVKLVSTHLAQLIFVHALRAHIEQSGPIAPGWLRALRDPRLVPALRAMHSAPGRAWTLSDLAKAAAMSRTTFACHFKAATGLSPLAYLTQWRMTLAKKALREGNTTVAALAQTFGYTSESAFNHAFKRITGSPPRRYRVAARA